MWSFSINGLKKYIYTYTEREREREEGEKESESERERKIHRESEGIRIE